ncbi:probable peptidyl-tRNA hydrolase 2 [Coccinella septempunctata]|uniref:probable peptidyl-tRNA hydrolase 2 n=1 Tax=Coccinella septempunctata TaxID=41139 RepID=UPI001D0632B0|nr:probable peptidyl-tRNA hydrolase 2 [Coccinella septempunctata]
MSDSTEKEFEPNEEFLEILISMGLSKDIATEALFCTGNQSIDSALNFIFSNDDDSCRTAVSRVSGDRIEDNAVGDVNEDEGYYKMTFVVNTALKMGLGKLSAQVAHACLGLYRKMLLEGLKDALDGWEFAGEKKVVLKGIDHVHLQELHEKAKSANIPCYLITDAGKTQIPPNSITVLSLFGSEDEVDKITGKLGLL